MSDSATPPLPQPMVYLIHDDQDRAVADLVARHFSANGMPAWCRGQRPPKGQGADQVLKRSRAAVLISTDYAVQSQLVHVDMVRAGRDQVPLARLILEPNAEAFGTDYATPIGAVTAYGDLDEPTMASLFDIVRPVTAKRGFSFSRVKPAPASGDDSAAGRSNGRDRSSASGKPARQDASALGLRMTLTRLAPLLLIGAAFLGGATYWWMGQARKSAVQQAKLRVAERAPLPAGMQDLAAGRLVETATRQSLTKGLPPGIKRAGYDAEPAATDADVADAATALEVTVISRSAFSIVDGKRVADIQVTVANKSDKPQPVVALAIGLRDKSNLVLGERTLKVDRRWVPPGATRVIEGQVSDLPGWTQSISIKVSATKA